MRIKRLKVTDFRNLKEVEIAFTESAQAEDGKMLSFRSHAIIGQNGAGKSNLFEAIITIFRDLDLDRVSALKYELDYEIPDRDAQVHHVQLKAQEGLRPTAVIDGRRSSPKEIIDHPNTYLPAHIFTYYSGKNERIEELFHEHLQRFNQRMRLEAAEQLPSRLLQRFSGTQSDVEAIKQRERYLESRRKTLGEDLLRRLFYCRGGHTQLVLLACFLSADPVFAKILEDLNIIDLNSALFVLKQPHYLCSDLPEANVLNGDSRFWYAAGTVVSEFLDKLWQVAVAPIDDTADKLVDFRGRREKQEQLYLFVPDKTSLARLAEMVGPPETFFRYAEGAYIGDLIDEVRINVKHKDVDGNVASSQLSEGELQLLTVLGLMRITRQDNCLFLLDEPDTHLNPLWKLRYFDAIDNVSRQDEDTRIRGDSQVIISTHDPLMIAGLRKEQVRIFKSEAGDVKVKTPTEHPQGMGIAGLLKSELFGLPSTLDRPTLERLHRRNELLGTRSKRKLTSSEETELNNLRSYLDDLGFQSEYRDPLYKLFIEQMYEVRSQPLDQLFTPNELEQQEALAKKIVTKLVKQEKAQQLSSLAKELSIVVDKPQ